MGVREAAVMNLSIWVGVMDDWYSTMLSVAMCMNGIAPVSRGSSGGSISLISGTSLLGSVCRIAVVVVMVSWNRRFGVLVGGSAVGFWGSSRRTSHAGLVGRTEIADALLVLVMLLFHDCRAASAHSTELSVVVRLLVALPERGLLAGA